MKKIKEVTFGTPITARELRLDDIPMELYQRLFYVCFDLSLMIDDDRIRPSEENDAEADGALTALTTVLKEAWKDHAKPAAVDPADVARKPHGRPSLSLVSR
jgi:hypothetical protein